MEWMIAHIWLLYSAILTLSVFNVIVLLWLALTVLLNASRRTRAVWLAGLGLLAGALFFISHTAFVVQTATGSPPALTTWWTVGWLALVYAPYAWYLALLWHAGCWDKAGAGLRRRHLGPLLLVTLLAGVLVVVFATARPLHANIILAGRYFVTTPVFLGMPILVVVYPIFVFFCIGLAFEALMRPAPAILPVQEPARLRARPWLIAASVSLLGVSVLMLLMLIYLVLYSGRDPIGMIMDQPVVEAYWDDLIISLAVTVAVISTGQAVVAYEIFTGRTLPRRGLRRQWQEALALAAGFGLVVGVCFAAEVHPIYTTLLAMVLVSVMLALLGYRAHLDRQRSMAQLRPLAESERVFERALASDERAPEKITLPLFETLCRDTLETKSAHLIPAGYLVSLAPASLSYPADLPPVANVSVLLEQCNTPEAKPIPVDPATCAGANWAIPLRSTRGPMGLLLLGGKTNGGLYSEEEIEIARAGGERLLDMAAALVLTRRLVTLQRQRLSELRVLDRQSRRVLHDEVLPAIHAALLELNRGGESATVSPAVVQLTAAHKRVSALMRETPSGAASQVEEIGLLAALREAVTEEYEHEFGLVEWSLPSQVEVKALALPATTASVVYHAAREVIRNAARHARGGDASRPLRLTVAAQWQEGLVLSITDDGVGLRGREAATTSGHGLELHSTMLAIVGGSLITGRPPGGGTHVTLHVPWVGDGTAPPTA